MNRLAALGAVALLAVGLGAAPATAAPIATDYVDDAKTCKDVLEFADAEKIDGEPDGPVADPEGELISAYCVKAGSKESGAGVWVEYLEEPQAEVTIEHPSGKTISHYAIITVPGPTPSPTPTPTPTPTVTPTPEPSVEPSDEPSMGSSEEPSEPGMEPSDAAEDEDGDVLASTGAGPAIGYALLALALAGGGTALLVLRKRRMS